MKMNEGMVFTLFCIGMIAAILYIGAYQTTSWVKRISFNFIATVLIFFIGFVFILFAEPKKVEVSRIMEDERVAVPLPVIAGNYEDKQTQKRISEHIIEDRKTYKQPTFYFWYTDEE